MISIVIISRDEPALNSTLTALEVQAAASVEPVEVLVVDASNERLDAIRLAHSEVRWINFTAPAGVRVSIPHQRNAGVAAANGDIIVFTDAGCLPKAGWLEQLVAPILAGSETVTSGIAVSHDGRGLYDISAKKMAATTYLRECPTICMAFRRTAFEDVGGFDERFEYGSDIDFSWRLVGAGHKIRHVQRAVVSHDWGTSTRQIGRAYKYGRARARLYRTHLRRLPRLLSDDPVVLIYPLFLLGLPISIRHRWYPALLLVPAWRSRTERPVAVVVDHLAFGVGVLRELGWP